MSSKEGTGANEGRTKEWGGGPLEFFYRGLGTVGGPTKGPWKKHEMTVESIIRSLKVIAGRPSFGHHVSPQFAFFLAWKLPLLTKARPSFTCALVK